MVIHEKLKILERLRSKRNIVWLFKCGFITIGLLLNERIACQEYQKIHEDVFYSSFVPNSFVQRGENFDSIDRDKELDSEFPSLQITFTEAYYDETLSSLVFSGWLASSGSKDIEISIAEQQLNAEVGQLIKIRSAFTTGSGKPFTFLLTDIDKNDIIVFSSPNHRVLLLDPIGLKNRFKFINLQGIELDSNIYLSLSGMSQVGTIDINTSKWLGGIILKGMDKSGLDDLEVVYFEFTIVRSGQFQGILYNHGKAFSHSIRKALKDTQSKDVIILKNVLLRNNQGKIIRIPDREFEVN